MSNPFNIIGFSNIAVGIALCAFGVWAGLFPILVGLVILGIPRRLPPSE